MMKKFYAQEELQVMDAQRMIIVVAKKEENTVFYAQEYVPLYVLPIP